MGAIDLSGESLFSFEVVRASAYFIFDAKTEFFWGLNS